MSTAKKATVVPFREGSTIAKMYNDLKDGKVHKYSTFRDKFKKLGVAQPRYMLFRLCRVLRQTTSLQINSSKRTDTVQMVERDKAAAARAAIAKHAKTPTKATSKAPVTKGAKQAKPKALKKASPKPVTVAAGIADDDDVLEA